MDVQWCPESTSSGAVTGSLSGTYLKAKETNSNQTSKNKQSETNVFALCGLIQSQRKRRGQSKQIGVAR
jgi:hypothetical protein